MARVCLNCNSRLERSEVEPDKFWCSVCGKFLEVRETRRVSKRYFSRGEGQDPNYWKDMRKRRKRLKGLKGRQRRIERRRFAKP